MTNLEIKTQLESIIAKIEDNAISAWNSDLENSIEAIATEDFFGDPDLEEGEPSVTYNGWYDDLVELIKKIN
jgi:hypothetical protein